MRKKLVLLLLFAMIAGLTTCLIFVYLPVTVQEYYTYRPDQVTTLTKDSAPKYLDDYSITYSNGTTYTPIYKHYKLPYPDFGVDIQEFVYIDPDTLNWTVDGEPPQVNITRHRFGWPMRAMYWDHIGIVPGNRQSWFNDYFDLTGPALGTHAGIQTPSWWVNSQNIERLPIRPLWIGILINCTIFGSLYFGFTLLLGWMFQTFRSHKRKSSGLCVSCGYAIEGLKKCPECGAGNDFTE